VSVLLEAGPRVAPLGSSTPAICSILSRLAGAGCGRFWARFGHTSAVGGMCPDLHRSGGCGISAWEGAGYVGADGGFAREASPRTRHQAAPRPPPWAIGRRADTARARGSARGNPSWCGWGVRTRSVAEDPPSGGPQATPMGYRPPGRYGPCPEIRKTQPELVRMGGFEPPWAFGPLGPEPSASACSATSAPEPVL
jgi:hypothetical protein